VLIEIKNQMRTPLILKIATIVFNFVLFSEILVLLFIFFNKFKFFSMSFFIDLLMLFTILSTQKIIFLHFLIFTIMLFFFDTLHKINNRFLNIFFFI
jgi:hypothetical protein